VAAAAATASAVTLAYVWLTLAYVVVVVTFFEATENGRIRFFLDPLVVVLLSAAVHAGVPRVREALSTSRPQRRLSASAPADA
jgi:hypothetical protein